MYTLNAETIFNMLLISAAVPVVPNDDADLEVPGILYLDASGTAGTAHVELLNGGEITIDLVLGVPALFLVKRVYEDSTAVGMLLNPLSQRQ